MRALPLIAVALTACATIPEGPPPAPPEASFRGVKGVALVHRVPWPGTSPRPGETRRRDPLDALQGALADRGVKTVTVELPERPPAELGAVDVLARELEWGAEAASPDLRGPSTRTVSGRAAPVLGRLGVDALVVYVRAAWRGGPQQWPLLGQPMMAPPSPTSAMAVVARDGTVVTLAWGGGADPMGSEGPINAAEAVDAVLALLAPAPE